MQKERLTILLLGSGGREAAIAWKLSSSSHLEKLFIAPGNAGTEYYGVNIPNVAPTDFEAIASVVEQYGINIIVVGPEEPLVNGIVDYFAEHYPAVAVIGPSQVAARIEGSKAYSKEFMRKNGIPTARYRTFSSESIDEAESFLNTLEAPYVIKADGLAAGKGVIVAETRQEASEALQKLLNMGSTSEPKQVVIEEFLRGIECSMFIATDGESYILLPEAKDYKRIGDGDTGPNTGGMGAVSPVPFVDNVFTTKVEEQIIKPTLEGFKKEGVSYKGFLFLGLMNCQGDPYVIEYNCRLGDPETEAIMPRIASDLGEMVRAMALGELANYPISLDPRHTHTLVLASRGYPTSYVKGYEITLPHPPETTLLFHAGTTTLDGKVVTNGGRVLALVSYGDTAEEAMNRSYTVSQQVLFEGKNYRHDIGKDLLT